MQEENLPVAAVRPGAQYGVGHNEAHSSGVSWAAIFAGAISAAALALILLALGAGFGLSSVSPWSGIGLSASEVGTSGIVWLLVSEVLSSAMGGYLAGRLRTKWTGIHSDEVYFRDTAHGFLAWCTALLLTAAFLGSAATALLGHSVSAKEQETSQTSRQTQGGESYFVEKLFRGISKSDSTSDTSHPNADAIFARALAHGALSEDDKAWLDQLVSSQTGLSTAAADGRVSNVFAEAQQAADTTRKEIAHALLWMFIALLLGAFTASLSATFGGRQRDHVVMI